MLSALEINFSNSWRGFAVAPKADPIRVISSGEGIADRLRVVAFAELQARDAFNWGADHFESAPEEWRANWREFALVENRHAQMLLDRMGELGIDPAARKVTDKLTRTCRAATDPLLFLFLLSGAEERGMEAGFVLGREMQPHDAKSAAIFQQIAEEEVLHVDTASAILCHHDFSQLKSRAQALSL